jgi:hypothetical protein
MIFGAAAITGAWLTALAVVRLAQLPDLPTPTAMGGARRSCCWRQAWFSVGDRGLSRLAARVGARRRAAKARKRLHDAISAVALDRIVGPIAAVLARHARVREFLDRAAAR